MAVAIGRVSTNTQCEIMGISQGIDKHTCIIRTDSLVHNKTK